MIANTSHSLLRADNHSLSEFSEDTDIQDIQVTQYKILNNQKINLNNRITSIVKSVWNDLNLKARNLILNKSEAHWESIEVKYHTKFTLTRENKEFDIDPHEKIILTFASNIADEKQIHVVTNRSGEYLDQKIDSQGIPRYMQIIYDQLNMQVQHDNIKIALIIHKLSEKMSKLLEDFESNNLNELVELASSCQQYSKAIIEQPIPKLYKRGTINFSEFLEDKINSIFDISSNIESVIHRKVILSDIYRELLEYILIGLFHTFVHLQSLSIITTPIYLRLKKRGKNSLLSLKFETTPEMNTHEDWDRWFSDFIIVCDLNNWSYEYNKNEGNNRFEMIVELNK